MALTRILCGASSSASERVSIHTAAFDTLYTPADGRFEAMDASVTMLPP